MARIPTRVSDEITQKYSRVNDTFVREVKSNPKDSIVLEVGDSKQPDFKPQAKIMRWDNEVNFSLRAQEHPDAVVETEGKLIKYKTPEYEVHQYELDPGEIGEDGGLEFEWVLPKKPSTNVISATIQTKGLNFFYQPALTQEEIDQGSERPENVVGSYAVYHATKGGMNDAAGMEYKVGKAFHIYRPKVTDANGVETWGELNIDEENGLLTITVDQDFLDNAVYPVVVDPTFGYTSAGASIDIIASSDYGYDSYKGNIFTAPEAGTLDSLHVYFSALNSQGCDVTASVWEKDSEGSNSHGLVATQEIVEASLDYDGWNVFTLSNEAITATDYCLAAIGDRRDISGYDSLRTSYDNTNDTPQIDYDDSNADYYDDVPHDPLNITPTSNDDKFSIYATYTAGGGTTTSTSTSSTTTSSSTSSTTTSSSTSTSSTTTSSSTSSTTTSSSTSSTTTSSSTSSTTTSSSTSSTTTSSSTSTSSTTTSSSTSSTTTSSSTSSSTSSTTTSSSTTLSETTTSTSTSSTTTSSSTSSTTTSSSTSSTTTSSSTSTSSTTTSSSTSTSSTTTSSSTSTSSTTTSSSTSSTTTSSSTSSTTTSSSTSSTTTSSSTSSSTSTTTTSSSTSSTTTSSSTSSSTSSTTTSSSTSSTTTSSSTTQSTTTSTSSTTTSSSTSTSTTQTTSTSSSTSTSTTTTIPLMADFDSEPKLGETKASVFN